jgi:hypothetical protein
VPTISLFYGISIRIYMQDHAPPHFHAQYGSAEARFTIPDAAGDGSRLSAHGDPAGQALGGVACGGVDPQLGEGPK